jgi:hypothetical protein
MRYTKEQVEKVHDAIVEFSHELDEIFGYPHSVKAFPSKFLYELERMVINGISKVQETA